MSQEAPVYVSLEFTPNPNTLKYSVNRALLSRGTANFLASAEAEGKSPLAVRLFGVPGISGVMIGKDFVTVTKAEDGDWDTVHKSASSLIKEHLGAGEPAVSPEFEEERGSPAAALATSEAERKIREILDQEVRPAVAMDGGDITFERFEDGVVYVYLQGSCSGCPSSTYTLKQGIETRLKAAVPEVREVVSV